MSEQDLDPELSGLADALTRLKPRPAALDRDALMFRAGRASVPRGWQWPLATAAATLVAISLGLALLIRPQPAVIEHTVYVEVPAAPTPESTVPVTPPTVTTAVSQEPDLPAAASDYQRLQDHLLRWGFDGLPPTPHSAPPKETPESLFRSL